MTNQYGRFPRFLVVFLRVASTKSWCFQTQSQRNVVPLTHELIGNRLCAMTSSNVEEDERVLQASPADWMGKSDNGDRTAPWPLDITTLQEGIPKGFFVVKQYPRLPETLDWELLNLDLEDVERLSLTPNNISLPVALMILDPEMFPTLSRARKACRKGSILVQDDNNGTNKFRGRVGDRARPGDVIALQVRMMGHAYQNEQTYTSNGIKQPSFDLPILYQDDHMALVNKPAGIVVYQYNPINNDEDEKKRRKTNFNPNTVRAALAYYLTPPAPGTVGLMKRPTSVHRLDKGTSGILCVAKTKPAMIDMSRQFHDRIVKKTYVAIVNGIPQEDNKECIRTITSREAYELGADVDPKDTTTKWQCITSKLNGDKEAITVFRALKYVKSLHAHDGYLTLVEVKPKTGRFHQIRRHMAWICERPLVGDEEYDGGTQSALKFRERGLFLCSTRVVMEHPYYNAEQGRQVWETFPAKDKTLSEGTLCLNENNRILVIGNVDLPDKFTKLLAREEERYHKFQKPTPE